MEVDKGSLVILEEKRRNNLYKLIRDPRGRATSSFKVNIGENLILKYCISEDSVRFKKCKI